MSPSDSSGLRAEIEALAEAVSQTLVAIRQQQDVIIWVEIIWVEIIAG
ncbi:MAG TPA: hypothetical protein VGC99_13980 [Candidatus Tectomicrobia bacterium]